MSAESAVDAPPRPEWVWVHFACAICGRRRSSWRQLFQHAHDSHGTIPNYAASRVEHATRRPPVPGGLPVCTEA